MEETITVVPDGYKIKGEGVFNLKELYVEIYRWFTHFNYDWKETQYKDSMQPSGTKMIEVRWISERKVDDYITYVISLQLQAFVTDVEAVKEGMKIVLNKGTVEFRTGTVIRKNIKMWEKWPWPELWYRIYERILIRERLEKFREELFIEAHKLYDEIKAYLEMHKG